jgi:hypothetical protein
MDKQISFSSILSNTTLQIRSSSCTISSIFDRFCGEVSLDLPLVLRQSSPTIPILMLYQDNPQVARRLVYDFAMRKQMKTLVVSLSGAGIAEDRVARKKIQKAAQEVLCLGTCLHTPSHLLAKKKSQA